MSSEYLDAYKRPDPAAPTTYTAVESVLVAAIADFISGADQESLDVRCAERRRIVKHLLASASSRDGLEDDALRHLTPFIDMILQGLAARVRDGADLGELRRAVSVALRVWPEREGSCPASGKVVREASPA